MRRADDLDVEPVRVVPPVVERRGDEHCAAAPGRDEGANRAGKTPDPDARGAKGRRIPKCGCEDQVPRRQSGEHAAGVNRDMRRRPEGVAPDRAVPRDIPVAAHVRRGDGQRGAPQVPGNSLLRLIHRFSLLSMHAEVHRRSRLVLQQESRGRSGVFQGRARVPRDRHRPRLADLRAAARGGSGASG